MVNLLPGQPFRAPFKWCAAHNLIFFFHSVSFRSRAFERRLPSESHCQRARFEGTKKPIGVLHLDRRPVARPSRVVAAREASPDAPHRSTFFMKFFEVFSNSDLTRCIAVDFEILRGQKNGLGRGEMAASGGQNGGNGAASDH